MLVSIVFPIFASFKALEAYNSNKSNNFIPIPLAFKEIDQQNLLKIQKWFIYWIVFGIITFVELILFLNYLPFYYFSKCLFNIWLLIPFFNISKDQSKDWIQFTQSGSGLIYFTYLKPFLNKSTTRVKQLSFTAKLFKAYENTTTQKEDSLWDNSYVIVKSITNRFHADEKDTTVVEKETVERVVKSNDDGAEEFEEVKNVKKGWIW